MKIRISEIFEGIQGEGRFAGQPMLFVRLSGCSRACSWCDTKYHIKGKEVDIKEVIKAIRKSKLTCVCFTGGEPLLQKEAISLIQGDFLGRKFLPRSWHIETNGDFLDYDTLRDFEYVAISPKDDKTARRVRKICSEYPLAKRYDIKIVSNLKDVGVGLLKYATMVMPFTTYNKQKDLVVAKKVWQYCLKTNKRFSPRLQYLVYGKKRGV